MDMYHIHTHDHGISMVVGAKSYRQAAEIVSEIIAGNEPEGDGGICCVGKLCGPDGGGIGYYAALMGNDRWYHISPNKVRPLLATEKKARSYLLEGGNLCPFCGSSNIESGKTTSYDANAQEVTCNDCGKEWEDIHTLTDVKLHL